MTRILIAEDDRRIRDGLVQTLESEGYVVTAAMDGKSAIAFWKQEKFDLIVLDVMMPYLNGYDTCREIRKTDGHTPILFLTAKTEEIDKVVGLKMGGDDYVAKPFGIHELLARIEALIRRSKGVVQLADDESNYRFGALDVTPLTMTGLRDGHSVSLTQRELKLMRAFVERPQQVLSRQHLLDVCWGVEYLGTTRTLDQHIAQLRKKVEPEPGMPTVILTVHGVGYRYVPCE